MVMSLPITGFEEKGNNTCIARIITLINANVQAPFIIRGGLRLLTLIDR